MSRTVERKCVGCGERKTRENLVRMSVGSDTRLVFLSEKPMGTRSAYLHPSVECAQKAFKRKSLQRAFRRAALLPDFGTFLSEMEMHVRLTGVRIS